MDEAEERRRRLILRKVRRRRIILLILCLLFLLAVVAATVFFALRFPVEKLEIKENTVYTEQQIRDAAGIVFGNDSLLLFDTEALADRLERSLPYIGEAKVGRRLPNIVTVDAIAAEPAAAVATGTDNSPCIVIDKYGKVLGRAGEKRQKKLPTLRVSGAEYATPGDEVIFPDDSVMRLFTDITDSAKSVGLDSITLIDITNAADICITYMDRIVLLVGSPTELERKLAIAAESLRKENEINPNQRGELNLKTSGNAFFRRSD